jgi:hypothetical protein
MFGVFVIPAVIGVIQSSYGWYLLGWLAYWFGRIGEAMIAWINFAVLAVSALLFLFFYVRSARPAALEQEIG